MKNENQENKNSFLGLTPLLLFLVLFIATGIITKDFTSMPVLVAFMIVFAYSLILNKKGEKLSIDGKVDIFSRGGGEPTIILMVVIFILAGAFYSVAGAAGAVESTVNLGLSILPAKAILPGVFMIGCIISFAMGTSMWTITAIAPIAIGMSQQTGISLPLMLGTVVGGAMFGDNLSFVSDTTIAATRTQGVELRDKFKMNGLIVLPAVILTIIILALIPLGSASIEIGEYSFVKVLPYLSIIVAALAGLNVMVVLAIGVLVAAIVGLGLGAFGIVELLGIIEEGFKSMEDLSMIAIVIGGIIELMKHYGGIGYLLEKITSKIKTKKGAELGIAALASLVDMATANNTISIVSTGPLAKDISEQYDIDPRRTASLLDIFSSAFQGIVPYGGQILAAAGLANLSPVQIVPYSIYSMLMIVFGIASILTGLPRFKRKAVKEAASANE